SEGLTKAINIIFTNPATKKFIAGIGSSLETFAKYLTTGKFSQDFDSFIDKVEKFGDALMNVAEFINKWIGTSNTDADIAKKIAKKEVGQLRTFAPGERERLVSQIPSTITVRSDNHVHITTEAGSGIIAQVKALGN
ncbi:MAG TPA: hypothetical protein VFM18_23665, partial [Methanosarcina sp.]|nr:hypothetical protein [Methanosarcina sp.]